jgi:hypothetical protein
MTWQAISARPYNLGAYWAWKGGGDQLWENYWNNSDRTMAFDNKTSKEAGRAAHSALLSLT